MGGGDHKSRNGQRQRHKAVAEDSTNAWDFAAAVAKSAQFEADNFIAGANAHGSLPMNQLAHVPSPHRQRGVPGSQAQVASFTEASPTGGSYRDKLRANGQRALLRSWDGGFMARPGLPPPPPPPLDALGGSSPGGSSSNANAMSEQEQYMAMYCAANGLQQPSPGPSPVAMNQGIASWTTPSTGPAAFWPEQGHEMQDASRCCIPMQDCHQAPQMMANPPLLSLSIPPSNMGNGGGHGLMEIAMPQFGDMSCEQILAQLAAADPVRYED